MAIVPQQSFGLIAPLTGVQRLLSVKVVYRIHALGC